MGRDAAAPLSRRALLLGAAVWAAAAFVASPAWSQAASAASAAATARLATLDPSQAALNELQPDGECRQVVERFDVYDKAADYAGAAAQLRFEKLVTTDFQQSDFSESDKQFLRYLAATTIWVPSSVESGVGKLWETFAGKGGESVERSGRSQRAALARQAERMAAERQAIDRFPGDTRLVVDPDLRDGALSKVGGMIVLSPRFLSLMDEQDGVRDILLAHELAHLYKRHALKALQYELLLSAKGWNIARRLLRLSLPKAQNAGVLDRFGGVFGTVKGYVDNVQTAKEVYDFVRDTQIRYGVQQEFEADACAVRWMPLFDIEPRAAWTAFAGVLQAPAPDVPGDATYAALHPSPAERDANIARALGTPAAAPGKGADAPAAGAARKPPPRPKPAPPSSSPHRALTGA